MIRRTVKECRREWAERLRAYGRFAEFVGSVSVLRTRQVRKEYPSHFIYCDQSKFAQDLARAGA